MKTLLICHEGAAIDQEGLARWLASFSDLVGLVVLQESYQRICRRMRRELRRGGISGLLNVLAFRTYYRLFISRSDERWEREKIGELRTLFPEIAPHTPVLRALSPNTSAVMQFMGELQPDIVLARCKTLLREEVFSIPSRGTFVMHPGICPEYRNSHGCFWALANGDVDKVGMSLLKIDKGVDTGPVYGYYSYPYNEAKESHVVIQHRVVLENLEALKTKLIEIADGMAVPLDTSGRRSAAWGKPWLTSYIKWRLRVRKTVHESRLASLP